MAKSDLPPPLHWAGYMSMVGLGISQFLVTPLGWLTIAWTHTSVILSPCFQVRFYGAELACAIQFLHDRRIVYRDVKAGEESSVARKKERWQTNVFMRSFYTTTRFSIAMVTKFWEGSRSNKRANKSGIHRWKLGWKEREKDQVKKGWDYPIARHRFLSSIAFPAWPYPGSLPMSFSAACSLSCSVCWFCFLLFHCLFGISNLLSSVTSRLFA